MILITERVWLPGQELIKHFIQKFILHLFYPSVGSNWPNFKSVCIPLRVSQLYFRGLQ